MNANRFYPARYPHHFGRIFMGDKITARAIPRESAIVNTHFFQLDRKLFICHGRPHTGITQKWITHIAQCLKAEIPENGTTRIKNESPQLYRRHSSSPPCPVTLFLRCARDIRTRPFSWSKPDRYVQAQGNLRLRTRWCPFAPPFILKIHKRVPTSGWVTFLLSHGPKPGFWQAGPVRGCCSKEIFLWDVITSRCICLPFCSCSA